MKTKIEIYQDNKNEWRWRARRGGKKVANCGEGYVRKAACLRSLLRFIDSFQRKAFTVEHDGIRIGKDGSPLP